DIDTTKKVIAIADDGWGMDENDINNKYLKVGYSKRENEPTVTPKGRNVMGRKGIGKLSLFSIAETIEVHSVKRKNRGRVLEKNGFAMNTKNIAKSIQAGNTTYAPDPIDKKNIKIQQGSTLFLRDLKKGVGTTEIFLRKRLARRFSVIGKEWDFSVCINGKEIEIKDRDYFTKIEYIWCIGPGSEKYRAYCTNYKKSEKVA